MRSSAGVWGIWRSDAKSLRLHSDSREDPLEVGTGEKIEDIGCSKQGVNALQELDLAAVAEDNHRRG